MTNRELTSLLRDADPVGAADQAPPAPSPAEEALLAEIVRLPRDREAAPAGRYPRRRRRRPLRYAAALGAVAAAVVIALLAANAGGPSGTTSAYAAELVRFANSSPLILIGEPGWQVEGVAAAPGGAMGEMTFVRGAAPLPEQVVEPGVEGGGIPPLAVRQRQSALNWYSPVEVGARDRAAGIPHLDTVEGLFRHRIEGSGHEAEVATSAPVLDTTARVFQYPGGSAGDRDIVALWIEGGRVVEFRAQVPGMDAFLRRLRSLVRVDATTWLDAMPSNVIRSYDAPLAVREMLRGVPLPPGFDPGRIRIGELANDRYQVGAQVAGTVACSWFARWEEARRAGDAAVVREATEAMATARGWPILREMSRDGGYPQILTELAADMPRGTVWRPSMPRSAWRPLIGDVWSALSCRSLGVELP